MSKPAKRKITKVTLDVLVGKVKVWDFGLQVQYTDSYLYQKEAEHEKADTEKA